MAFVTKEWKDRLVEFAGRRLLKNVATGDEATFDVSRAEGTVSQAGHAFSAATMNDLEERIKDGFDEVNTNLTADGTPFRFGKDSDGNYGYIITGEDGADSVIPFNRRTVAHLEWTNNSPNIDFSAQEIIMELSKYDAVIIKYKARTTMETVSYAVVFKSTRTVLASVSRGSDPVPFRWCTIYDDKAKFEQGYYGTNINNAFIIPLKIWGINITLESE